jgi:hypothetical protein
MPLNHPLPRRCSIGRSLLSAARARGFGALSLRETIWFYCVGLVTAALLIWSPSQATPPGSDSSLTARPPGHELSSEGFQNLPDVLRGLTEKDALGEAELAATNGRKTRARSYVSRTGRGRRRPTVQAAIFNLSSTPEITPDAAARTLGGRGGRTPLLAADELARLKSGQHDASRQQSANPRRRY